MRVICNNCGKKLSRYGYRSRCRHFFCDHKCKGNFIRNFPEDWFRNKVDGDYKVQRKLKRWHEEIVKNGKY